jgi:hypothetical protein
VRSFLCSFRDGAKQERPEMFTLNQWIHGSPLAFPRYIDSAIAGPEGAKNLAGKKSST